MEEKLYKLYKECILDLKIIGIDVENTEKIGEIDIKISKRKNKRYGCCKQEEPDTRFCSRKKVGRKIILEYEKFNKHHIEISQWVMQLNDDIIKNTIMHEIIHCFPKCNNHGVIFKKYASTINEKLGYNITRLGNSKEDLKKSNIEYKDKEIEKYKYKIICKNCGQVFYRQRLKSNFVKKYRCGVCKGQFSLVII